MGHVGRVLWITSLSTAQHSSIAMTHTCWPCGQGAVAVEGEAHLWRPGKRVTATPAPASAFASDSAKHASEGEVSSQDATSDAAVYSIDLPVS